MESRNSLPSLNEVINMQPIHDLFIKQQNQIQDLIKNNLALQERIAKLEQQQNMGV